MTDQRRSLVERIESDPAREMDLAAAGAAVDAVALVNRAVGSSGRSQRELARRIGVSEGRVSQVLHGDGNVRVSTLARFLRAAGYELQLSARPVDAGAEPLPERSRRTPRERSHRFVAVREATCVTEEGIGPERVVQFSASHPRDLGHEFTVVFDLQAGEVETDGRAPSPERAVGGRAVRRVTSRA